jgi:hypothetical protein
MQVQKLNIYNGQLKKNKNNKIDFSFNKNEDNHDVLNLSFVQFQIPIH